ncbi:MAG: biotin/lipoyl-binding protein [Phycisphaeraceae bacterium]|nr:biotin/lipoyl-binding protein [Phycisphaeraceae bacterium]
MAETPEKTPADAPSKTPASSSDVEPAPHPGVVPAFRSVRRPSGGWRRVAGVVLGPLMVLSGLASLLFVAVSLDVRPRTLDAAVRANTIGIAPHVSGPIVDLRVVDNQPVVKGEVLFVVDPRPYAADLADAEAALALIDMEIAALRAGVVAAARAVEEANALLVEAEAEAVYARLYLDRVRPLLSERFVTPDQVDKAATEADALDAAVTTARARIAAREADLAVAVASLGDLDELPDAIPTEEATARDVDMVDARGGDAEAVGDRPSDVDPATLNARRVAAAAAVAKAELYLDYCTVRSPLDGYVTNLNIAVGEYANEGRQVFALVDGSVWYVMANFKETFLSFIDVGDEVEVYLMARPSERWRGVVQGVGWAIDLADGRDIPRTDLPRVDPTLDWVRLARRFPVRIILEDGPEVPIRMGETAAVIVLPGEGELPPAQFPWLRSLFDDLDLDD